jgi:hypothetical protein
VIQHGGVTLLELYGHSLVKLLANVFPEHDWLQWSFIKAPKYYWKDRRNQREFLDTLSRKLNFKSWEDWYQVTPEVMSLVFKILSVFKVFQNNEAGYLLDLYNGSPSEMIQSLYPEYPWLPWKFSSKPTNYWQDPKNRTRFFEWFKQQIGYTEQEQWYAVSAKVV